MKRNIKVILWGLGNMGSMMAKRGSRNCRCYCKKGGERR